MEFESQVSVTGLPDERTTIVGIPVFVMAFIRGAWAPTREKSFTSTCSPVLRYFVIMSMDGMVRVCAHVALSPAHSSF